MTVELGRALDLTRRASPADRVPLWLRAAGLRIEHHQPGKLLAWCRLNDSQFLAQVEISVSSASRPNDPVVFTLWVTQDAIQPPDDVDRVC